MLRFAVVGIDHGHTFDHVKGLLAAGGEFVGYCPQTTVPAIREMFEKTYPDAPQIDREKIFADPSIDVICIATEQREMRGRYGAGRGVDRGNAVRYRLRQVRIEVVRGDGRVGRQRSGGQIARHPRVVAAVVREHLTCAAVAWIPDDADPRRSVVLERKIFHDRARQRFLLVTHAGADGQRIADSPFVPTKRAP